MTICLKDAVQKRYKKGLTLFYVILFQIDVYKASCLKVESAKAEGTWFKRDVILEASFNAISMWQT